MSLSATLHDAVQEPAGGASSGRIAYLYSTAVFFALYSVISLGMVVSMIQNHQDVTQFKFPVPPWELVMLVLGAGGINVAKRKFESADLLAQSTETTPAPAK